jgi:enoyl-CoA hydratase/carnithine racemase
MAAIKRQVWQAGEQTIEESLDWAIELMQASLKQADFKEGVTSFVERRPPAFPPVQKGWATDIEP